MGYWLRLADWIDAVNDAIGRAVTWLSLVMVALGAFNAIARYLDRFTGLGLSSNTWLEGQWYLFSLIFLLGAAYTLRADDHVRVDVLYSRLSRTSRAWINIAGTLLFLFPLCIAVLVASWDFVLNSWQIWEQSPDPGGLPRYPIKTVIPVALVLLMLQGVSLLIRETHALRTPPHSPPEASSPS